MRPRFHPADHGDFYAEPEAAPAAELRAVDCNTPEQWAEWARQRLEYEDPYGYGRRSRRLAPIVANPGVR